MRRELSAERRAHSPTVQPALVRWPKESDQEKAPGKKSINFFLRVSVRFVYHQIVLGARSPNHQSNLKFADAFVCNLTYRFGPGLDNTKYGRIFNIILIRIIRNTWSSQV